MDDFTQHENNTIIDVSQNLAYDIGLVYLNVNNVSQYITKNT